MSRCHADVITDWGPAVVASELGRRSGRRLQPASTLCAAGDATVASWLSRLTVAGEPRRNATAAPRAGRGPSFDTRQWVSFLLGTVKAERKGVSACFILCKVVNINCKSYFWKMLMNLVVEKLLYIK